MLAPMAAFIYRCATTGRNVQGWRADDPPSDSGGKVYETVKCAARTRHHLINVKTGKTLGDDRG